MPVLANFLLSIFGGFVAWLAKFLTQKIAVATAIITLVTVLFVALYAALRTAISAAVVGAGSIHPMFGAGVSMVVSPHSASLISSYVVFWSLVELYKWKVNLLSVWSKTI